MIFPSSNTRISSASCTVERRCAGPLPAWRPAGRHGYFQQGILEELRVLKDKGDPLYQGLLADLLNINAANQNTALSCIIKAGNELRCGGFAAAGSVY